MTAAIPGEPGSPGATIGDEPTLPLVEERLRVGIRRVSKGTVRISSRTELVQDTAEVELDRYRVEVTRVPVGRIVEAPPVARAEGDTTIIPVVEERLVVVKQLFLKEELHIRHVVERESVSAPVTLRRQRVTVERTEAERGADTDPVRRDISS